MVKEYGYEYDATLDEDLWKRTEGKTIETTIDDAIALRSGRDALKAIARSYMPTTAYLPALSCDSMIVPFKMYGHKVKFYRLTKDYSIDKKYLYSLISDGDKSGVFLYMDYFGNKALSDDDLDRLRAKGLTIIEDRTHNYIYPRSSEFQPDYTVVSLRKWLNIPDGGLLWGSVNNQDYSTDTSFSSIRLKAQCMRHRFLECGDEDIKKQYRKIFSSVSDIIDEDPRPGRMTAYSAGMLTEKAWSECKSKRRRNSEILIELFKKAGVKLIQDNSGISDLYVPILVEKRDDLQKRLSATGLFTTLIWPISQEQRDICRVAKYTEDHMLGIPCDQRYNANDMTYIGDKIVEYING